LKMLITSLSALLSSIFQFWSSFIRKKKSTYSKISSSKDAFEEKSLRSLA
jgi:hypothetical protein